MRSCARQSKLFPQAISRMDLFKKTLRLRLKKDFNEKILSRTAYTGLLRLIQYAKSMIKLKQIQIQLNIAEKDKHPIANTKDLKSLVTFKQSQTAHPKQNRGSYEQYTLAPALHFNTLEGFQKYNELKIFNLIQNQLQVKSSIKIWAQLAIDGEMRGEPNPLYCGFEAQQVLKSGDIHNFIKEMFQAFTDKLEGTSYFNIKRVKRLDLHVASYKPLKGSSLVELPVWLSAKKAVVNVNNTDNKCFMWAVLSAIHPQAKDPNRVAKYKQYETELDFTGINFPVTIDDIPLFAKLNPTLPAIDLYTCGETSTIITPLITSKSKNAIKLLIYDNHYMWIKTWNRLVNSDGSHKHICPVCMGQSFKTQDALDTHIETCGGVQISIPKEGSKVFFKNVSHDNRVAIMVYADFESVCEKVDKEDHVRHFQEQKPASVAWKISIIPGFDFPCETEGCYTGSDAVEVFVKAMRALSENVAPYYKETPYDKTIMWTKESTAEYNKATQCAYCKGPFSNEWVDGYTPHRKVPDHCHLTGKYRSALHQNCNFQAGKVEYKRFIPIVFHNLKGYDGHHIIRQLGKDSETDELDCIATNTERYLSFSLKKKKSIPLRFIDSLQFMNAGLETLIKNNRADPDAIHTAMDTLPKIVRETKGVFPYDWFDSLDKLKQPHLPSKDEFFSRLYNKAISDDDYATVKRVWSETGCRTMQDYHDLYLKADVYGLCDVFESFRNLSLLAYGLDPCYYYGAPGLAWDAMLKKTGVSLDQLSDPLMYEFFEKGIRGGISVQSHRHFKAEKDKTEIKYFDANNLYGWSMSQELPQSNFKWWYNTENTPIESLPTGTYEVDIVTPEELHDYFNEYPVAETITITEGMISPTSKFLLGGNKFIEGKKLCGTLHPKRNYVLHLELLKQLHALGHKITVHRGITYDSAKWMKTYIDFNTGERAKTTTDFGKDFFKLMNNSVFGKTMENVRRYSNFKLIRPDQRDKYTNRADFKRFVEFGDNLYGVDRKTTVVNLNKPIYVGQAILDLSKVKMNELHYLVIKKHFGDRAKLLMTDTDSLVYGIASQDVNKELLQFAEYFDFSNFAEEHEMYDKSRKAWVGLLKLEEVEEISEFVGLRAKCYSMDVEGQSKSKSKGVPKSVVKENLKIVQYRNVLFSGVSNYQKVRSIVSHEHRIFAQESTKKSLSAYDDKRWILEDGITTRAYGHFLNK